MDELSGVTARLLWNNDLSKPPVDCPLEVRFPDLVYRVVEVEAVNVECSTNFLRLDLI